MNKDATVIVSFAIHYIWQCHTPAPKGYPFGMLRIAEHINIVSRESIALLNIKQFFWEEQKNDNFQETHEHVACSLYVVRSFRSLL